MKFLFECDILVVIFVLCSVKLVNAQEEACSAAGSIAAAVVITFIVTLLLVYGAYLWYKRRKRRQGKIYNNVTLFSLNIILIIKKSKQ